MPASIAASSSVTVFRRLAEVQARRGFDAVGAVAEQHVIGVEGENLALRVALFDLNRDDRLLDFPLEAEVADAEADGLREELRASCWVSVLAPAGRPSGRPAILS